MTEPSSVSPAPAFSLVVPAYDEAENIPILIAEIDRMLQNSGLRCEMILVDDGSRDSTLQAMMNARAKYPQHRIRILSLKGNHGLSAALDAGFRSATCDVVVCMDSDLQNDPADIPRLLDRIADHDAVLGVRAKRRDGFVKRMSSRIANRIRNFALGETIRDTGCTLKAFRRSHLTRMRMFNGMHRFFPSLLEMQGAHFVEVEVNHRPRTLGKSKYHLWNRLTGPLDDLMAVRWMKKRNLNYEIEEK